MPIKKVSKKPAQTRAKKSVAIAPKALNARIEKDERKIVRLESSRFALYIYWMIIVFFVGATFYILGRSYSILNPKTNVEVVSESAVINIAQMTPAARADLAVDRAKTGKAKLLAGNVITAIADLSIAIEAAPDFVDPYIIRGEAFMQTGDYNRAMEDFNMAINLDPVNSVALYDRAILSARMENFDAALVDLADALSANNIRPSDIISNRDIMSRRAQIMLWNKDFEGAVVNYNAAIAASTVASYEDFAGRAEAWTALGMYQQAADDYLAAITIISNTIQNADTNEQRNQMSRAALSFFEKSGALHVTMGDMEGARTDLEAAYTLAATMGDTDTTNRLQALINDLK
ncbi:MAG: hypothetical protein FWG18_00365 [Alphaproteobacteria bacterium]|nr:hypothetical protein [Alphaproteobacteria bacterium]